MLQYNPTVTGSLQVSGDITGTVNGINITGLSQSVSTQLISVQVSTGSSDAKFETLSGVTSSALTRLTNIETKSASVDISISNINSITASNIARLSNLETKSSSVDISLSSINSKTGSYATTGSNQFYGTQVFSGSVYIANDLIVQGSSSIQYISASSVSIGTNIVQLNTANPSVRFAGLTIIDSGSVGGSGSFLYDSVQDEFIFVHRGNGTNVTSSHFVLGPETYDSLGNETYLTSNIIPKGTGKEHLVDSCIFDNGTTTCIKNNLVGTGTACFTSTLIAGGITAGCGDIIVDPVGKCVTVGRISAISGDNSTFVVRDRTDVLRAVIPGGGSINTVFRTNASCVIVQNYSGTDMFRVANDGTAYFSGNVGIGTSQPSSPLSICGTYSTTTPLICITGTGTGVYQRVITAINPGMNAGDDLTIQMGTALCYRNVGQLNYHHEGSGCATNRMSIGLYGVDDVFNVTGNGFVGIGTTTTCGLLSINAPVTSVPSIRFQNSITAGLDSAISNYVSAAQTLLVLGTNSYITSVGTICRFNTSYESSYISFDEGTVRIGTGPTSSNSSAKFTIGPTGVATFSCQIQTNGACVIVNRGDGNPAVLSLGNASNSYQIQYTCIGGQRLAFVNGAPSEFASFYGTGVSVFTGQTCINGSGAGLQFTGGNNRIYFGACRAIEGNTSGTTLQIGENYGKTQIQSSAQMYNGSGGNSPKLYFGEEGNETPGAKAIYLDTYWMVIQPHVNEGLRIRAVNGAGTQSTIAKFYGSSTFSLDQYSNGTLSVNSGIVVSSSDKCMKIDDGGIDIALPKIMCLNPRYFYWKPETCLNSCDRQLGFYAQDVSEALGTEVANQSHNCSWGIYDRGIIAMLTKGIQEQQCRIKLLESCLGIS